jgi:hypothetical protein
MEEKNNITKESILKRITDLKVNGLNVQKVGTRSYGFGRGEIENALVAQVRMTDPSVNERVSVMIDIHQHDTLNTLSYKLDIAEGLLSQAQIINTQKEQEELINNKRQEAMKTAEDEMIQLKKNSPILYDFLSSNLELESPSTQMMSPN